MFSKNFYKFLVDTTEKKYNDDKIKEIKGLLLQFIISEREKIEEYINCRNLVNFRDTDYYKYYYCLTTSAIEAIRINIQEE